MYTSAKSNTTSGMFVKYAIETTAGTMPVLTSAWTKLKGVKAIPAFGTDIPTAQDTDISELYNHTYVTLLRDSGGAINLTVNDAVEFRDSWATMVSALATARSTTPTVKLWLEYAYPEGSQLKSFYFPAEPAESLGFGGADVDTVLENQAAFVPAGSYKFDTPSGGSSSGTYY